MISAEHHVLCVLLSSGNWPNQTPFTDQREEPPPDNFAHIFCVKGGDQKTFLSNKTEEQYTLLSYKSELQPPLYARQKAKKNCARKNAQKNTGKNGKFGNFETMHKKWVKKCEMHPFCMFPPSYFH